MYDGISGGIREEILEKFVDFIHDFERIMKGIRKYYLTKFNMSSTKNFLKLEISEFLCEYM